MGNWQLPNSVDKTVESLAVPISGAVGKTLKDIWELVLGNKVSFRNAKANLLLQQDLDSFKQSIAANINNIPAERLREPTLQIAGQALEKSKYCVEETELREMFANLIARSMDSDYNNEIHPSFAEIISQMSPIDAGNLKLFKDASRNGLPLAEYVFTSGSAAEIIAHTDVFLENKNIQDINVQSMSIGSLKRLGLLNSNYTKHFTEEACYNVFLNHASYKKFCDFLPKGKLVLPELAPRELVEQILKWMPDGCLLRKGLAELTQFGLAFIKVCL